MPVILEEETEDWEGETSLKPHRAGQDQGLLTPVNLILFPECQVPRFINEKTAAQKGAVTHPRPQSQGIIHLPLPVTPQRPQFSLWDDTAY